MRANGRSNMQPLNISPGELLKSSKDRAFGEYLNASGHRCLCYQTSEEGPPQYDPGEVYFCFAKFQNPFYKNWIGRYAALAVYFPTLDLLHDAERGQGRPLMAFEWPDIPGVITTKPMK